jgi:pyruvate,water dikinase
MEIIQFFTKINKDDVALAGGKGASLGEMTQAGIQVPPGFVIFSEAFEKFLEETDLFVEIDAALDTVDHKEMHTVEKASETIHALILNVEIPDDVAVEIQKAFKKLGARLVAVRSSATSEDSLTAAWAGQLETYLNTTDKTLLENVKKCWASLFTPRAIFYRFEKGLQKEKICVAVIVQEMVESVVAGIGFSVHPVTQDENQLIIEAGFGLGEAVVSGQITPDSYVVDKEDWVLLDIQISKQEKGLFKKPEGGNEWQKIPKDKQEKQKLSGPQIIELSKLIVKIEQHYGFPVDIEWAIKGGKFYITQSRPITTL